MKKNIFIAFLLFIMISPVGLAQQELTLQEAVMGRWGALSAERLGNLAWIPETHAYTYNEQQGEEQVLVMVDATSFEKTEIIDTKALGAQLLVKKRLTRLPRFTWISGEEAYFVSHGNVFLFNRTTKKAQKLYGLPQDGANFEFKPYSTDVAFTRGNNLFAIVDGQEVQVTNHTDENIVAGQTVSRVEFGIEHGVIWSNSGNYLAFYEKDETAVTNYPLVDYTTRPATLRNTKYPMAGMESEQVRVGVYSLKKNAVTYLATQGEKDQYLVSVSWGPKDKMLYVGHLSRSQKHLEAKQYNASTGKLVTHLFTEENSKYVHPTHGYTFLGKNDLIYQSEKSGINQLYAYNVGGKTEWQIATPNIIVQQVIGVNTPSSKIYFLGNHKDQIDQHVFEVTVTNGGTNNLHQLTKGNSYNSQAFMNTDKSLILTRNSSPTTPNAYDLVNVSTGEVSTIFTAANPLANYQIGQMTLDTLKAADGSTLLHDRIIYPYNFDETKKYPVLVYVYNGPGVQLLHNSWLGSAPLWMFHFANKGYLVYTVDGRGSSNRGIEFEQSTYQQLGQEEMLDQLAGIQKLKQLAYVDTTRFAVHGWSYGGFMTTSLLTSYPGMFKAGVAGGPVMDWRYYEIMYTERYMNHPDSNATGYDLTSNLLRAKKLTDPLLIIHGTVDPTVVKQHSDLFLKECIKNGVQVDYFEYPGHEHNVYGQDRVHLMEKILNYIERYL